MKKKVNKVAAKVMARHAKAGNKMSASTAKQKARTIIAARGTGAKAKTAKATMTQSRVAQKEWKSKAKALKKAQAPARKASSKGKITGKLQKAKPVGGSKKLNKMNAKAKAKANSNATAKWAKYARRVDEPAYPEPYLVRLLGGKKG